MSNIARQNLTSLAEALDDQINLSINLALVNTLIKASIEPRTGNQSGEEIPCQDSEAANDPSTGELTGIEGASIDGITLLRVLEVVEEILKEQGSEIAEVKAESRTLRQAAKSFGETLAELHENLRILKEDYGKLLKCLKKSEDLLSKQQRLLTACTCRPKSVN